MTLRHYGRALAAASGAVLLCATLSVPALATPTSDTGAAAPVAASATDEGSAPITVTVTRTDSHGDKVYEGDLITVTVTYTNNTDSALTVFPVDSNLSGVLTTGAPNCRWHNLAAHTTKQCTTATHTVTADDVAAGQQNRDRLLLDGGGGHEAHVGDGLEQVTGKTQVGEGDLLILVSGPHLALVPVARRGGALDIALVAVGVGIGVDEGGVAVNLVLINVDAVVLIGVVDPVLRVGLGEVSVDVVRLLLVVDVLRVLRGVGGGGSGEVLGGGGGAVAVVRRGDSALLVVLSRAGLLAAGELGGEERIEAEGAVAVLALSVGGARRSTAGVSHEVFPYLSP